MYTYNWWIVVFPILLWLGNAVCSSAIIYITATLRTNALLNINQLSPFLTSFLVLTLATNLITTGTISLDQRLRLLTVERQLFFSGLIVWRIWSIHRETSHTASFGSASSSSSRLTNVIRIVVESGLIYTSLVLITFGTELAGNNAIYGVSDVVS